MAPRSGTASPVCRNCDEPLQPGARFCSRCGEPGTAETFHGEVSSELEMAVKELMEDIPSLSKESGPPEIPGDREAAPATPVTEKELPPREYSELLETRFDPGRELAATWVALVPSDTALARGVSIALFLIGVFVGVRFILRVRYNLQDTKAKLHLSPFV